VSNIVYAWNYFCCYVVIDITVRMYCSIDDFSAMNSIVLVFSSEMFSLGW
jgi:hypothetical protein